VGTQVLVQRSEEGQFFEFANIRTHNSSQGCYYRRGVVNQRASRSHRLKKRSSFLSRQMSSLPLTTTQSNDAGPEILKVLGISRPPILSTGVTRPRQDASLHFSPVTQSRADLWRFPTFSQRPQIRQYARRGPPQSLGQHAVTAIETTARSSRQAVNFGSGIAE
jgi:hypothetical protein